MAYVTTSNISFADRVRAVFADLAERKRARGVYYTTVNELSSLSTRELADLGIHRSEIKRIAYEAAYTE